MLYESDADRERESEFALNIENRFTCQLIKLTYEWEFDYLIARNKQLTGIAELKVRTHASNKYDTVIFSDHKAASGFKFCEKTLCYDEKSRSHKPTSFIFFVKFTDKPMYAVLNKDEFIEYRIEKLSAANHADDPSDTEYVRYIPIELFKGF